VLLLNAQQALATRQYDQAAALIDSIQSVLKTRAWGQEPEAAYLQIVQLLAQDGYDVQDIDLDPGGSTAAVTISQGSPALEVIQVKKVGGTWKKQN
jgi:hypothetical protein